MLEWCEEKNETLVLFIDWGNKEWCSIDQTTRLSDNLRIVKPMAINCRLKEPFPINSAAYLQLFELVSNAILFDLRMKRADLERYFQASLETCGDFKCECELITVAAIGQNGAGVFVNNETLSLPSLWKGINQVQQTQLEQTAVAPAVDVDAEYIQAVIRNIKIEPESILEEDQEKLTCSQQAKVGQSSL